MKSLEQKKERRDRAEVCSWDLCPEALNTHARRAISASGPVKKFSFPGDSIQISIMVAPQNSSPTASVLFMRLRFGLGGNDLSSTRNTAVEPPGDTDAVRSFFA